MKDILKKLNKLLDAKQKRTMAGLGVLMVIGAVLQTAGVSMLVSVVSVVVDPEAVSRSKLASMAYKIMGTDDFSSFSVMVMVMLVIVFILKNLFLYIQQKAMYAFVYTNQFRTSELMMKNYIRRNYEYFLNAETAVVQRSITSDVNNMYALILALLQMASDGVVSACVIAFCLVKSGVMTIIMAVVLGVLLLIIKNVLKPIMRKAGEDNQEYYSGLFKWISQMVQGIKDVKVFGREKYFIDSYCDCGKGYVGAVQKYSLYNSIPKLLIETVCVATMVGYMIVLVLSGASTDNMLSVLTTLAAAAFVLLPAVNRINNQLNSVSYFEPFLRNVSDNLQYEISRENTDVSGVITDEDRIEVKKNIVLEHMTYSYPNTDKKILDDATMEIPVGSSVGIVGTTGAGKSTVADILLGLLDLQEGKILADGRDIKDNYRGFLKNIGYIPQVIYMLDDNIRRNVAFGIKDEDIDEDKVWKALEEAKLDEFVKGLPDGLDTGIGERGIRISGGQRQRIGIARALYHDPDILIMDEATSSLDGETEKAIMDSINTFLGKKTMVIIAHRLQTIEKCDTVYRVENGQIKREK
ncbi:MAG: ABC transporter ATP-binding protein/permease [Lachnospiraceae bacterium]|nr:ABC transporter ATP-binding protein/permease [Lachnospiraceae bacterium]